MARHTKPPTKLKGSANGPPKPARPTAKSLVIVGIGASAGGLEPLRDFLRAWPTDSGLAVVVMQHQALSDSRLLTEILCRCTELPVSQVDSTVQLTGNHIYVIPPGHLAKLSGRDLVVEPPTAGRRQMPIDIFFRSLAGIGERAIGVILSGTGADGALGLTRIKENGGAVFAQTPATAQFDGMPQSAIRSGMVDVVAAPTELPALIIDYAHGASVPTQVVGTEPVRAVLQLVRTYAKLDFRHYKSGTVTRRIQRRMGLLACTSIADYLTVLRSPTGAAECRHLAQDLLIGVTCFFRDKEAFELLATRVLRPLLRAADPDIPVRLWVPGCSTGEEAYSIAMLLLEQMAELGKQQPFKIFATDIDATAIEKARQGYYPESIATDVSPERLARFFVHEAGHYQIRRDVREAIVFAEQDVVRDPPYSKIDLISCRNLLIYLEQSTQAKVLAMFQFALKEGGHLFLGPSESLGVQEEAFHVVSKTWRLFLHAGNPAAPRTGYPLGDYQASRPILPLPAMGTPAVSPLSPALLVEREILAAFAPATVLVNAKLEVLYFHGPVERYLGFPTGKPPFELSALCPVDLRTTLRHAIRTAPEQSGWVRVAGSWAARDGSNALAEVAIKALEGLPGNQLFMLVFTDAPPAARTAEGPPQPAAWQTIQDLEREVQRGKDELKNSSEEMESANEELRASNEEMKSMNEELQSTLEEMETTKEELQSLNEELVTVNQQSDERMRELEEFNNDLRNLFASTELATIFLDLRLRIKRFTPHTDALLNVLPTDVGRPIGDLTLKFDDPSLMGDLANVLEKLMPLEKEIHTHSDRWFRRRIIPYRTEDNRISGVVLTFTDVTVLRRHIKDMETKAAEIAAANARLRELDGLKGDFINAASHELRTPLSTIVGYAEFLEDQIAGDLTKAQHDFVSQIQGGALRLQGLVDDLLDFARLEAGTFGLMPRATDLNVLVRETMASLEPQVRAAGLKLVLSLPTVPIETVADPNRLGQVLLNLAGNAIKFSPPGGELRVRLERVSGQVRLEVKDEGIGINASQQAHVFDKFYQADPSLTREHGGAGLGLAISRALIEAHGGTIGVKSRPGKGSTFWVLLPLERPVL